jgi:hypothetical protein
VRAPARRRTRNPSWQGEAGEDGPDADECEIDPDGIIHQDYRAVRASTPPPTDPSEGRRARLGNETGSARDPPHPLGNALQA